RNQTDPERWIVDRQRCRLLPGKGQTVAVTVNRMDVLGIVGVPLNFSAETTDRVVHRSRRRFVRIAPYLTEQFASRHDGSLALGQIGQQIEFASRQAQFTTTTRRLERSEVDERLAKRDADDHLARSSQHGPNAGLQFLEIKWFRDVIVRAKLQPAQ